MANRGKQVGRTKVSRLLKVISLLVIVALPALPPSANFIGSPPVARAQDSCEIDPCGGDPCCGDPCCGDPCCYDPCCGDPCCGDPCCGDPCCGDPCCGDPCCGDPECGGDDCWTECTQVCWEQCAAYDDCGECYWWETWCDPPVCNTYCN